MDEDPHQSVFLYRGSVVTVTTDDVPENLDSVSAVVAVMAIVQESLLV